MLRKEYLYLFLIYVKKCLLYRIFLDSSPEKALIELRIDF